MSQSRNAINHFESSLKALAQIIFRETQANGFTIFEFTGSDSGLVWVFGVGAPIAEAEILERTARPIAVFPLHTTGVPDGYVAFSFSSDAAAESAGKSLANLCQTLDAIWDARLLDSRYEHLLGRLRRLESRLLDSKIVDRARGLLADSRESDIADTLYRHVRTVLRPSAAHRSLESMIQELEDELEERRVTSQAKALLQTAHSLSEEQAYTHLRMLSRKSRRRLKDVALDVTAQYALEATA